jgi:hypothetical protein
LKWATCSYPDASALQTINSNGAARIYFAHFSVTNI